MAPKLALLLVLCVALLQLTQARVKQTHHSHRAHVHVSHHRHPHPHARAHAANPAVLREREFESGGNYGVEQAHIGGTQEQPMLLEEDAHLYGGDRGQRAMHAAERHLSRADQRMEQYDMPQQEQQQQQQQQAMYAQQQAPPQPRFQQVQHQMPTLSFDGAPAMTAGPTLQQNAAPSLGDQLMAHAQAHNDQAASFGHTALQLPPLPSAYPARQQLANNAAVPPIFLEAQNLPPPPDVSNTFSSSEWASPAGMAAAPPPPFQQGSPSPFQAPPALMANVPVMLEQQATFRAAPGPMQFPQMAMQPAVPQMAPQPPSFAPAAPAYNSAQFASSITQPRFMETYADAVTGPYGNALEDPYYDAQTLARANAPMMPMQANMPQQQQSQNKGMPVPPAMPDLPPPPVGIY